MDNYNGDAVRVNETDKGNGEGEWWEESIGDKVRAGMNNWEAFTMVLCNYFVSGGMYPVESMGFAQITYLTRRVPPQQSIINDGNNIPPLLPYNVQVIFANPY